MLTWYPREDQRPLRVAVLCSHRAPGLSQVLADARRGDLFDVVACISSEHDFVDRERIERQDVPTFVHDIHDFYRSWGTKVTDLELRKNYDATMVQRLALHEPDVVILCSYLYIVTCRLLEVYPDRVVNIHHSDLVNGRANYPGLHAVRDAIMAGERETRASAHLVTHELDAGPPIARSWAFPVHPMVDDLRRWNATKILKAYAYAHQEWMIESTWAPMMLTAIELFARGELQTWRGETLVSGRTGPVQLEPPGRSLRSMRSMRTVL
jgi:folate-dependent phosphoribosylglycinamide formyltransferase PurN